MSIVDYEIHPDWDTQTHDIALLKLSENLVFDDFIKPIPLPNEDLKESYLINNEKIRILVAGWGLTLKGKYLSQIL